MQVKLNFTVKNLDGEELLMPDGSPVFLHKLVANWIMNSASKASDVTKMYLWATELYKTGHIDLSSIDVLAFKDFIDKLDGVSVVLRFAILDAINRA